MGEKQELPASLIAALDQDRVDGIIERLKLKYQNRVSVPESLGQLKADNPEIDFEDLERVIKREYKDSIKDYLTGQNLLKNSLPTWDDVICNDGNYIIPEGIREIPDFAFKGKTIKSLSFPSSLVRILENAFTDSYGTDLIIPKTVKKIFQDAFSRSHFETISFEGSLKDIPDRCFSFSGTKRVVIPEGVEKIGYRAFNDCFHLEEVVFPSTLKTIGWSAFRNCDNLKSLLGKPLDEIDISPCAFDECDAFADENGYIVIRGILYKSPAIYKNRHVVVPEGVTGLSSSALIPDSGTHYRDEKGEIIRYGYCQEITLPHSITELERLDIDKNVKRINLPKGITIHDQRTLENPKLKVHYY